MINKTTQQNISEEWKEDVFGSLYDEPSRNGLSKPSSVRGVGYKMVNMGELFRHECITEDTEMELVPLTESEKKISFLKAGDLLFARQSLVLSGVGKCVYFSALTNDITFESHIIRVRLKDKISYSKFYFYYFQSALGKSRVMANASMLAAAGIRGSDLQKLKVPIPKYQDQERVVIVLKTWEQAIEKLKRKIEIKREVKKGLMLELLTGKTRLSSFTDCWTEVKFGSLGKLISGGTPSKLQDEYWAGEIPWISSSDLRENDIKFVNIHRYITLDAVRKSATNVVPQNSVVIVSRVGVGKVIVSKQELCTSQDFQSLVVHKSKADSYFLAYLLILELQKLLLRNQGTSIKGFLKKDLENLIIKIPTINEQEEIANFLNAFSEEIEILQKKLLILKDQKKYLLNNLVTGTIRTPESLSIPK